MKKAMIVFANLNTNTFSLNTRFNIDILSEEWIKNRLDIFMKYTRKSLEGQENQNFWAFISINPQTKELIEHYLKEYKDLPKNIIFTTNRTQEIVNRIEGYDWVYLTKVDSDDMYHPTYIDQLYKHIIKADKAVIINQEGYIFNDVTKEIASYSNFSPAFYTQLFNVRQYIDVYQYYMEISHVYVNKLPYETINDRKNFIVVAHGENTFTNFERYREYIVTQEEESERIKKEFKMI